MIRSATFCSMPQNTRTAHPPAYNKHAFVCGRRHIFLNAFFPTRARVQQARVRLRAPPYIFERVFSGARPRTKKTIVRRFTGKQPRSIRPSAAADISALYLLYYYLKDISR